MYNKRTLPVTERPPASKEGERELPWDSGNWSEVQLTPHLVNIIIPTHQDLDNRLPGLLWRAKCYSREREERQKTQQWPSSSSSDFNSQLIGVVCLLWCNMKYLQVERITLLINQVSLALGVYPPRAPTIHKLCLKSEMVCKPKPHMIISPRIRSQLRTQLE